MPKTICVGLDVSQDQVVESALSPEGQRLGRITRFPNTLPGAQQVEAWIVTQAQTNGAATLRIGTEATSFFDLHLANYLVQAPELQPYFPEVYRLNARQLHQFKKSYPEQSKTDIQNAFVIADFLRFGRLPAPYRGEPPYAPLRRLTRYRHHLVRTLVREQQYFMAHLFLKCSGLVQERPAGKPLSATAAALATEFLSADELAGKPTEELVAFLVEKARNRFADPGQVAREVQRVARQSYRIGPGLAGSVNLILASTLQTIRTLRVTLKEVNEAIAREFAAFPNTLQSVPGIGPVYAAGIFAEIGEIGLFRSEAQLAKLAGLAWKRHQSGKFEGEESHLVQGCNKHLRYYLIEAANSVRRHDEEYRRFYERKYQEVRQHRHKRALVLTARKLVRLVYALLVKGQLYDRHYSSSPGFSTAELA